METKFKKDLLLIGVPLRDLNYPPLGLALLKGILHNHGYDVSIADANLDYYKHTGSTEVDILSKTFYLHNKQPITLEELKNSEFGQWIRPYLKKLIDKHRPRAIGLSIFTHVSNLVAYYMGKVIKELIQDNTVVIIGGHGAESPLQYAKELGALERPTLAETMKDEGLIDTYVLGDGENAIVEFMKDLEVSNPQEIKSIDKLDELPFPDFHELDLKSYQYVHNLTLPVTGSKGCVRRCTFCDIPGLFGKYRQRDGKSIAQECIHMYETYGARTLYLTDSLVNGSMKAFLDFINTLAELKLKKSYNDLEWTGQYITRPAHQIPHAKDYYPLMAASGAKGINVGAESGSNKVLKHMDKKMTVEDLFIELDYFQKYGISMVPNVLPSYPTETREDFEQTLDMVRRFQPYIASGAIEYIGSISWWYTQDTLNRWHTYGPNEGYFHGTDKNLWWYKHNPELTLEERVFRRIALSKALNHVKVTLSQDERFELKQMLSWYESQKTKIKDWYESIPEYKQWYESQKTKIKDWYESIPEYKQWYENVES